jgi:protein transport protein SEC31
MAAWNPLSGQFLHEVNGGIEKPVAFDVQWSPRLPNILSTGSYDGKVNVQSINYTGPAHVPAWLSRPIGASFGFDGKLELEFELAVVSLGLARARWRAHVRVSLLS